MTRESIHSDLYFLFDEAVEKTILLIESKYHSQQSRSESGRMTKAIRLCFDFESKLIVSYYSNECLQNYLSA